MIAKVVRFRDSYIILTDTPVDVPGADSLYLEHFDLLSSSSVIEFECSKEMFNDVKHSRGLLKQLVDLYMVKEISIEELRNINSKRKK